MKNLQAWLKRHNYPKTRLGRWLGIPPQNTYRWLDGSVEPKQPYLLKLRKATGLSIDVLLDQVPLPENTEPSPVEAKYQRALEAARKRGKSLNPPPPSFV